MKISVILTSFNRPRWIQDSLRSIESQTHRDIELIVIDESSEFDIEQTLSKFKFKELILRRFQVSPEERRLTNRLSLNCNLGLSLATGELVCFMADDDYYYPTWLASASACFEAHPEVHAAFGKLAYSPASTMVFPNTDTWDQVRFYKEVVSDPFGKLDHNQVIHRRFQPPFQWPAGVQTIGGPDAHYFREIAQKHPFHPIHTPAAVKRLHPKGLMESQQIYINGFMEGLRE